MYVFARCAALVSACFCVWPPPPQRDHHHQKKRASAFYIAPINDDYAVCCSASSASSASSSASNPAVSVIHSPEHTLSYEHLTFLSATLVEDFLGSVSLPSRPFFTTPSNLLRIIDRLLSARNITHQTTRLLIFPEHRHLHIFGFESRLVSSFSLKTSEPDLNKSTLSWIDRLSNCVIFSPPSSFGDFTTLQPWGTLTSKYRPSASTAALYFPSARSSPRASF